MELAKEAAAKDKILVLSLSAPFIPLAFKDALAAAFPYVDYVLGNDSEAAAFAQAFQLGTEDLKDIAKHIANMPKENSKRKRVAIVTRGTDATLVAIQGEDEVKEYPVHVINKEDIKDTTGAGDAFAGGLCAGILGGKTLSQSIDIGQWLASLTLSAVGPTYVASVHLSPFAAVPGHREKHHIVFACLL